MQLTRKPTDRERSRLERARTALFRSRRVGPPGDSEPPPSLPDRSRRGRILFLLIAVLLAVAVGFAVATYRNFASDIHTANSHLPKAVEARLAPNAGVLSAPQVTLVQAVKGPERQTADTSILFRTDPHTRRVSMLSLPNSVVHHLEGAHQPDRSLSSRALVARLAALRGLLGVGVNHVVLIDLRAVGSLIDAVGGVTVNNPRAFDTPVGASRYIHFDQGTTRLDGRTAPAYLAGDVAGSDRRERIVLGAVVQKMLGPSSFSELSQIGNQAARVAATDISPENMLGLVWLRLRSTQFVGCGPRSDRPWTSSELRSTVQVFLDRSGAASSKCRAHTIGSLPVLPSPAVVQTTFDVAPYVLAGLLVVLVAILLVGVVRSRPVRALAGAAGGAASRTPGPPVAPRGAPSPRGRQAAPAAPRERTAPRVRRPSLALPASSLPRRGIPVRTARSRYARGRGPRPTDLRTRVMLLGVVLVVAVIGAEYVLFTH